MKKKTKKRIACAAIAASVLSLYCMPSVEAIAQEVVIVNLSENENTHSGALGENLTWTLDNDGLMTISGTGEMINLSLFENVIVFGNSIESENSIKNSIKHILIEDGVTSIGDKIFSHCENLTVVNIPDSVTSIGINTFYGCSSLTKIIIPDSVKNIGNGAFGATRLTSITIPDGVEWINSRTFAECTNLNRITLPDSIKGIGSRAFYDCTSLTNITIPSNVTSIGNEAFSTCTNLTKINIPNGMTKIENNAFQLTNLTSIVIPDNVTSIGSYAFRGCTNLTSITIPDSVIIIGGLAFDNCEKLTDIYYTGTEEQWKAIVRYDDLLKNATIHYNSSASTPAKPEVDPKIENIGKYLKEYQEAMDNYVKAIQNASNNDKKTADKLKTSEQGYLALKEYDQKQSSRMITFTGFNPVPKEAQEDTYEVLYKFLKNSMEAAEKESIISFDIDKSKSMIEIEAGMVNKIYDAVRKGCENPDKGIGTHGYTVNLNICGGIFNAGFGQVTITNGNKTYTAVYCSNKETVAKVMNLYQQDLCSEVKKQYKDACLSLWRYFLDKSTIQSITNEMLEDKLGTCA